MIRAEVHSDDREYEIQFDATRYFEKAPDEDLIDLAKVDWGGDYPADWVAEFYSGTDREIAKMFEHVSRKDGIGFECHVNKDDALKWLHANRPEVEAGIKWGFGPREWFPKKKSTKKPRKKK